MPLTQPVRFRSISAKALNQTVGGPEAPYPVYRFGNKVKYERRETPGRQYRWLTS